jgi:hypothetical protein
MASRASAPRERDAHRGDEGRRLKLRRIALANLAMAL